MKRVLVTGASGFLGRHCLPSLFERGYQVHAVSHQEMSSPNVTWHRADLLQEIQVRDLMLQVRPSHLLHLAWVTEHGKYWDSPENRLWEKAGLSLLQAFTQTGGERVVLAGTCAEYAWDQGVLGETTTPLQPASLYGTCKLALSRQCEAHARHVGLSLAWARLFFLFGPGENSRRLVPSVIRSLLREEPALCTHGRVRRDFLFVADAADALGALLDSSLVGPINVASGNALLLAEMVHNIGQIMGRPDLIRLGSLPERAGDPPILVADVQRLSRELHWAPITPLDQGLQRTIQWWREQGMRSG